MALGVSEDAARVRVNRALEKLRALMTRKGVALGATAIAGAVTANAMTAAPVTLASTITTAALTGTTLTFAAVAMTTFQKLAVTAALTVTIGGGLYAAKQAHDARDEANRLQAQQAPMREQIQQLQTELNMATNRLAGLTEKIAANQKNNLELLKLRNEVTMLKQQPVVRSPNEDDDSWEVADLQPAQAVGTGILNGTKPQVRIVDSKYDHQVGYFGQGDSTRYDKSGKLMYKTTNASRCVGIGVPASQIIFAAYESSVLHTVFPDDMPTGRYDYIANLPQDSLPRLREEIKNKFGLVGSKKMVTTNAFALVLTDPDSPAFTEPREPSHFDGVGTLKRNLENLITRTLPVVDLTGLTNQYECKFDWPRVNPGKQVVLQALHDQLGLDLIATNMPIEMLVVEKVN
jgi:hypothetical protein